MRPFTSRSITCPYCFARFPYTDAPYRLCTPGAPVEADEVLGRFLEDHVPPVLGRVLPRRHRSSQAEMIDLKKICPDCHMILPYAAANGQSAGEIIAVVGMRSSGKSNFNGVLLNALEHRYGAEVGFAIYDLETFSIRERRTVSSKRLYRERYGNRLFHAHPPMAIDQTQSAETDRDLRMPLIYRLQFPGSRFDSLRGPFAPARSTDLVLFDAAGEDLADGAKFERFCRFVTRSSGVIFLIDPFQFPKARALLSPELRRRLPPVDVDPTEVFSQIIKGFHTQAGVSVNRKINIPTAIAFSKCDLLAGSVHPSSSLLHDVRHAGGFDVRDHAQVASEVKACLGEWGGKNLIDLAAATFSTHGFFAVSALGQLPDEQLKMKSVSPLRVGDPLLWLLWQRGYIRAAKN